MLISPNKINYIPSFLSRKTMKKNLKRLASLAFIAIPVVGSSATQCMEEKSQESPFLFKKLTEEPINVDILKHAAVGLIIDETGTTIDKLSVVCKKWQSFINQHKIEVFKFAICEVFPLCKKDYSEGFYQKFYKWCLTEKETCERFLNGKLVYKPNTDNDIGKIELRIRDLTNPLEGTFDLSQCGEAGKYLSISTGYHKEKKQENADKVEIWFAPRFLIERELSTTAAHFKPIMDNWKQEQAPVGLFWTRGGSDDKGWCDYLTTENMDDLSRINLYENWEKSVRRVGYVKWRYHVARVHDVTFRL